MKWDALLAGIALGFALGQISNWLDRRRRRERRPSCEEQGHVFGPDDFSKCGECGHVHDCAVDGHVEPTFMAVEPIPRCLACGEVLA